MSKKNKTILVVLLSVLVATGVWFLFFKSKAIEYKKSNVSKNEITIKILATGTVLPDNRLQIKSPISGRVESILVNEGDSVSKGQVLAWVSSTERAVILDSARTQGASELKKWEDVYKPTPIIAPLSGTVILRSAEPGQTFTTSDAIFAMSDRLTIQAQVDETDLAQISLGQKVILTLDAYLDKKIDAVVSQIAYEAKTVNNVTTYTVKIRPTAELDFLRSGMTANVTFFGKTKSDILTIPNEYIKYVDGRPQIKLQRGKKVEDVDISVGITDGKNTEILNSLSEGDTVMLVIDQNSKSKKNLFSRSSGKK